MLRRTCLDTQLFVVDSLFDDQSMLTVIDREEIELSSDGRDQIVFDRLIQIGNLVR